MQFFSWLRNCLRFSLTLHCTIVIKGRTIRKVMEGWNFFSLEEFFFHVNFLHSIFFPGQGPCTVYFLLVGGGRGGGNWWGKCSAAAFLILTVSTI